MSDRPTNVAFCLLLAVVFVSASCATSSGNSGESQGPNGGDQALSDDEFWAIMASVEPQFEACLEDRSSTSSGLLKLTWTLQANGTTTGVRAEGVEPEYEDVSKCFMSVIRDVSFPAIASSSKRSFTIAFGPYDSFSSYKATWLKEQFGKDSIRDRECLKSLEDPAHRVEIGWLLRENRSTEKFQVAIDGEHRPVISACMSNLLKELKFPGPSETPGWHRYSWRLFQFGWKTWKSSFTGTLSRREVWEIIQSGSKKIQTCYETVLKEKPGISGKVTLRWTIRIDGSVSDVKIYEDTIEDPRVAECIVSVVEEFRFPRPNGGEAQVVFPWLFKTL